MLPDLLQRWLRNWSACFVAVALVLTLTACTNGVEPPRSQLLKALTLQIELTQTAISRTLGLPEMEGSPKVSRVRIEQQSRMRFGESRGLKLRGRFDWQLPGDRVQVDSPFEIYMEQGDRGESWRLARPNGSGDGLSQDWLTYPLPLS